MTPVALAAVDLGASSGRVMLGRVGPDTLELTEVNRFRNGPIRLPDGIYWDVLGLYQDIVDGLRGAVRQTDALAGLAIDTWGVDYGLLDANGGLRGNPHSYRDARSEATIEKVHQQIDPARLYAVNGLQVISINTIYQLAAEPDLQHAHRVLLTPDLLGYWLTGREAAEETIASTTGLLDARTGQWAPELVEALGLPAGLLPEIVEAGQPLAPVSAAVCEELGVDRPPLVTTVGSHDTASAVVGVPAGDESFAYISSGTWSLVGLELDAPVLTEDARLADFTNETGVDGTIRFLRNVMGLWVLSECVREWGEDLPALLAGAANAPALRTVVDIDDVRLLPPGDMPTRVAALAAESGEPVPQTPVAMTRCVLDSLALAYRRQVRTACRLAGREVSVVHVVGGGAHNDLLCSLTADACGLPVLAGPTEAAALGNVLVQARALGADLPDVAAMRALVRRTHDVRRHEPDLGLDWDAAERRVPSARPS